MSVHSITGLEADDTVTIKEGVEYSVGLTFVYVASYMSLSAVPPRLLPWCTLAVLYTLSLYSCMEAACAACMIRHAVRAQRADDAGSRMRLFRDCGTSRLSSVPASKVRIG